MHRPHGGGRRRRASDGGEPPRSRAAGVLSRRGPGRRHLRLRDLPSRGATVVLRQTNPSEHPRVADRLHARRRHRLSLSLCRVCGSLSCSLSCARALCQAAVLQRHVRKRGLMRAYKLLSADGGNLDQSRLNSSRRRLQHDREGADPAINTGAVDH